MRRDARLVRVRAWHLRPHPSSVRYVGLERQAWHLTLEVSSLNVEAPGFMREAWTLTREALRVAAEMARLTRQARAETGQASRRVPEGRNLMGAALRVRRRDLSLAAVARSVVQTP